MHSSQNIHLFETDCNRYCFDMIVLHLFQWMIDSTKMKCWIDRNWHRETVEFDWIECYVNRG